MGPVFISIPTRDLGRATAFLTGLGFTRDPAGSDDRSARIVVNETTSVMLSEAGWFSSFTGSPVADPAAATEVSIGVTTATREEVDELTERAIAAGGQDGGAQDLGYMYMRAFRDLDGHRWSFMHFAQR